MSDDTRVAILGAGTMGRALGHGLIRSGTLPAAAITGTIAHERRLDEARERAEFEVSLDNVAVTRAADILLLSTKPKALLPMVQSLNDAGALAHGPLLVSVAAGVRTDAIEAACPAGTRVVRTMPNTPCLIGEGMTVISAGKHAGEDDMQQAEALMKPLGRVLQVDEEHLNTVTGLSGSGPAFVYVMIEALSEGGVMSGLPRRVATELAAQTVLGAARMVLETGRHPAELKDDVLTPAGCTIAGLLTMEDGGIRSTLARGVQEAARAAAGLDPDAGK